ncbi:MAG: HlyD family efflux transporter periplasmic adaptor subunit [Motiliproteus sp.]
METGVYRNDQPSDSSEQSGTTEHSGDQNAFLEPETWSQLSNTTSTESYASAWLTLQCQLIEGVKQGVVVLGEAEVGPFVPVAHWPSDTDTSFEMTVIAELAMSERKGSVRRNKAISESTPNASVSLAYPLLVDEQLCGVVALQTSSLSQAKLRAVMRQLQWGCAWLEVLVRQKTLTPKARLAAALELVAISLEQRKFQAAATAFVTELATRLDCEWVGIGFLKGKHTRLRAFSHSAEFDQKSNLMRLIGKAMDEALDQQALLVYPPLPDTPPRALRTHEELTRNDNLGHLCTIPMGNAGQPIGCLTLARAHGNGFSEEDLDLCRHIALLVGPVLDTRRKDDRWLISKVWGSVIDLLHRLLGAGHIGLKLSMISSVLLIAFLVFAEGGFRVSADATLEGSVQRSITAKFTGYISESAIRAGDVVKADDLLFAMEDKDLLLERVKWQNQKQQRLREYSQALANDERAQMRILSAQKDQVESQIALLDEQLSRTEIRAPFDGVVVSGDLSQMLGAPVERGQVMFQVAPLNSYRVILKVDERDFAQVTLGQSGVLKLASMPNQLLSMVIEKKTPVAVSEEGRNFFRVEARLEGDLQQCRPGMEGVGKIDIEQRKLIWIWTHELMEWVRFTIWSWWP